MKVIHDVLASKTKSLGHVMNLKLRCQNVLNDFQIRSKLLNVGSINTFSSDSEKVLVCTQPW